MRLVLPLLLASSAIAHAATGWFEDGERDAAATDVTAGPGKLRHRRTLRGARVEIELRQRLANPGPEAGDRRRCPTRRARSTSTRSRAACRGGSRPAIRRHRSATCARRSRRDRLGCNRLRGRDAGTRHGTRTSSSVPAFPSGPTDITLNPLSSHFMTSGFPHGSFVVGRSAAVSPKYFATSASEAGHFCLG